jgi:hypothetical protein
VQASPATVLVKVTILVRNNGNISASGVKLVKEECN